MINLAHYNFSNPINFLENNINILVLENPAIFSKMIRELLEQKEGYEGNFVLSKNYEIIDISKNIEIITDVFNLDFNSKKIVNKVYSWLNETANIDMLEKTRNIYKEIVTYLSHIIQYSDYPLTYNEDINITDIFKICNLKIDISADNLLEKIINYILLHMNIFNTKLFIFINLKCMLTEEELVEFYKTICYEKINILLIENVARDIIHPYERIRIIDYDMCELY